MELLFKIKMIFSDLPVEVGMAAVTYNLATGEIVWKNHKFRVSLRNEGSSVLTSAT